MIKLPQFYGERWLIVDRSSTTAPSIKLKIQNIQSLFLQMCLCVSLMTSSAFGARSLLSVVRLLRRQSVGRSLPKKVEALNFQFRNASTTMASSIFRLACSRAAVLTSRHQIAPGLVSRALFSSEALVPGIGKGKTSTGIVSVFF
jgi:hypothetical protein